MKNNTTNLRKRVLTVISAAIIPATASITVTTMCASADSVTSTTTTVKAAVSDTDNVVKHPGECGYNYRDSENTVNKNGKHPGECGYRYSASVDENTVDSNGKHPGESGYGYQG